MSETLIRCILQGREWSWSLIGMAAIGIGLLLRSVLLTDILRHVKSTNKNWYKRMLIQYERRAIPGWIFFCLAASGAMAVWRFEAFFLKYLNYFEWLVMFAALLSISLFLHLRAYARALVEAIAEQAAFEDH